MSEARSFKLAAKSAAGVKVYKPVPFDLQQADGTVRRVEANYPGDGSFILLMAVNSPDASSAEYLGTLMSFVGKMFSREDYRYIRERISDEELDISQLGEIIWAAMEEWGETSDFPTKPDSGSSTSPQPTGTSSTGRVRGPGSTLSASEAPAS